MDTKAIRDDISQVKLTPEIVRKWKEHIEQLLDENTKLTEHLRSEQQDLGDLHELYVQEGAAHREKVKQLLDENERLTEINKALESDNYNHNINLEHLAADFETLKGNYRQLLERNEELTEYVRASKAMNEHAKRMEQENCQLQADKAVAVAALRRIANDSHRFESSEEYAKSMLERIESGEKG